jgi:hypothetical protein
MKYTLLSIFLLIGTVLLSAQTDTLKTESGLRYLVLKKGNGPKAEATKAVEVHYTGSLTNGKVFDSSRERGEPIEFVLGAGQVIPGWDEGIALMHVGDQFKLFIPAKLGYGEAGAGEVIPPNSDLVFDVELVSVGEPKTAIGDALLETVIFKGIDSAKAMYYDLKKNKPNEYNFKESQLTSLGYQLIQGGKKDEGIAILKLNVEAYPNSPNVYMYIADAYRYLGQNDLALENYKKSLQLKPGNKVVEDSIKEIEAAGTEQKPDQQPEQKQ